MAIPRMLQLPDHPGRSVFLWGPRKTGKSTWIREQLTALSDDLTVEKRMVVSLDREPRRLHDRHGEVRIYPLADFVDWLWNSPDG